MKRFIALLLAGILFISLVSACGDNSPANEPEPDPEPPVIDGEGMHTINPPETTTTPEPDEPEPELIPLVNGEAEALFSQIMANKGVWEYENMLGGTLIDLDFDGTPEFLVFRGGEDGSDWLGNLTDNLVVYKLNGDVMEQFAALTVNTSTGAETPNKHLSLYTDEDGNKSWALPYTVEKDGKTEYRFSLFDFTGGEMTELVKFLEIYDPSAGDDYSLTLSFFYNGEPLVLSPEEEKLLADITERYKKEREWYERDYDDYMENSKKEFYHDEGLNAEGVYMPLAVTADDKNCYFFFDAEFDYRFLDIQSKWYSMKRWLENELISTAHKIDPNIAGWYHDEANLESKKWIMMTETELQNSLIQLVNAYVTNDEQYLLDPLAYSRGAMAKPVIYLYPEETTDVDVRVEFPLGGGFTCVYPDYGSGWSVTAHPDGTLINKADGREYSYLYWEGESPAVWDFSKGFVVKGSDTVAFLQEKLEYLGMKPREYNEFIVYWLPLMQHNAYNLITFQTDVYEDHARLFVSPEPDSVLRVFMAYKPLERPIKIPEQKLEAFERTGFSVIEWGGTVVK